MLQFRLFGPFRVAAPDGTDLSPSSQKAQGLLAIVLIAPDFRRPRAHLQDLLWSDRSQEQGAASLRQELTSLRKTLGEHASVLHSDRVFVWLDGALFETDCDANGPTALAEMRDREFLEGNAVRDPEFVDWLRDQRSKFEELAEAAPPAVSRASTKEEPLTLYVHSPDNSGPLARHLAGAISSGVNDWVPLDIRNGPPEAARNRAFVLETAELRIGSDVFVDVLMKDPTERSTLWRTALEVPIDDRTSVRKDITRLINEAIDRTLWTLSHESYGLTPQNANSALQAIEAMFRTHGASYRELSSVFEDEYSATGHGVFLAWQAFLSTYAVGERKATDRVLLTEEARSLVQRALLAEPHNALVLALCAHVNAFTLGDNRTAFELADRSVKLQANNPLGWLFRGIALINLEQLEEGRKSIARARTTTGEAPYRYLVDCTSCIAEMLSGNFSDAIAYGSTSLSYAPNFAPTLRYLLATYLAAGETAAAEKTIQRLQNIEPDFDLSLFAEPEYPTPMMKKYRVIDKKKLPKLL